jgi:hypothetical protein
MAGITDGQPADKHGADAVRATRAHYSQEHSDR